MADSSTQNQTADPKAVAATLSGRSMRTGIDDTLSRYQTAMSEQAHAVRETGKAVSEETRKEGARYKADVDSVKPPADPNLKPWTAKPPEPDPMKSFGSWATAIGIIGSALTRTPLTSALNAASGAMNAFRSNDLNAYQEAKDAWKANTEIVIKQAEWENKRYQRILDSKALAHDQQLANIRALAAEGQDDAMAAQIEAKGIAGVQELMAGRLNMAAKSQEMYERGKKFADEQQDRMEHRQAVIAEATPILQHWMEQNQEALKQLPPDQKKQVLAQADARAKAQAEASLKNSANGSSVQLSDPALELEATNMLFNGKYPPWMRSPDDRNKLYNKAAAMAESAGLTMSEAAMLPKEKHADVVALSADAKRYDALKEAQGALDAHLKIAQKYMDKLSLTDIQRVNQGIVAGEIEFGSADANNYRNAIQSVAFDWGRMQAGPQSAAMLPVEVVKVGMQRFVNSAPDQLRGEMELLPQEAGGIIDAQEKVIADRKKSLRNFNSAATGSSNDSTGDKYTKGTTYRDAQGNSAKYLGDGKWEDVR